MNRVTEASAAFTQEIINKVTSETISKRVNLCSKNNGNQIENML